MTRFRGLLVITTSSSTPDHQSDMPLPKQQTPTTATGKVEMANCTFQQSWTSSVLSTHTWKELESLSFQQLSAFPYFNLMKDSLSLV